MNQVNNCGEDFTTRPPPAFPPPAYQAKLDEKDAQIRELTIRLSEAMRQNKDLQQRQEDLDEKDARIRELMTQLSEVMSHNQDLQRDLAQIELRNEVLSTFSTFSNVMRLQQILFTHEIPHVLQLVNSRPPWAFSTYVTRGVKQFSL